VAAGAVEVAGAYLQAWLLQCCGSACLEQVAPKEYMPSTRHSSQQVDRSVRYLQALESSGS